MSDAVYLPGSGNQQWREPLRHWHDIITNVKLNLWPQYNIPQWSPPFVYVNTVWCDYDVKFNSSKSQFLVYKPPGNLQYITLNGNEWHISENGVHLGHPICNDCNVSAINQGVRDLIYTTNVVMSRFNYCNYVTRSHMCQTYWTRYYGCPLWRLNGKH